MKWTVFIRPKVQKRTEKFPKRDWERIKLSLYQMRNDPLVGDIEKMKGDDNVWRKRIGSYRIKFEISADKRIIFVIEIERRTSKTY